MYTLDVSMHQSIGSDLLDSPQNATYSPCPSSAYSRNTFGIPIKPRVAQRPRVEVGTYVAFSIAKDAMACLFDEDSEPYREIMNLHTEQYIGLVTSSFLYPTDSDDEKRVEELVIHYVSKSKPPKGFIVENHWMPIAFPQKNPEGRLPLQTESFFPWKNMKQWTTLGVRVIVENVVNSSLQFVVGSDGLDRFDEATAEDERQGHFGWGSVMSSRVKDPGDSVRLLVGEDAIPVDIWYDIRRAGKEINPNNFVQEMIGFES
jgi:hypothetical protein